MAHEERHGRGHIRRIEISTEEAKSLAFELAEAADDGRGPIRDDDGVIRAPWLERDGDRLFVRGESEGFVDISDGNPKSDHAEDAEPIDAGVTHVESPVRELKGWHNTADGAVLVSTEGTSWRPEAFVPSKDDR